MKMEIKLYNSWNQFFIPIPKKPEEREEEYLNRVKQCLDEFYAKNTSLPESLKESQNPHSGSLESLMTEHNFADMRLEGIDYCDVKYFVNSGEAGEEEGILVSSHRDVEKYRTPMLDFLKDKWRNFKYE